MPSAPVTATSVFGITQTPRMSMSFPDPTALKRSK